MYSLLCYESNKYALHLTSSLSHKTRRTAIVSHEGKEIIANIISSGDERKLTKLLETLSNSEVSSEKKQKSVTINDEMDTKSTAKKIAATVTAVHSSEDQLITTDPKTSLSRSQARQSAINNSNTKLDGTAQLNISDDEINEAQSSEEATDNMTPTIVPPELRMDRQLVVMLNKLPTDGKKLNASSDLHLEVPEVILAKNSCESVQITQQISEGDKKSSSVLLPSNRLAYPSAIVTSSADIRETSRLGTPRDVMTEVQSLRETSESSSVAVFQLNLSQRGDMASVTVSTECRVHKQLTLDGEQPASTISLDPEGQAKNILSINPRDDFTITPQTSEGEKESSTDLLQSAQKESESIISVILPLRSELGQISNVNPTYDLPETPLLEIPSNDVTIKSPSTETTIQSAAHEDSPYQNESPESNAFQSSEVSQLQLGATEIIDTGLDYLSAPYDLSGGIAGESDGYYNVDVNFDTLFEQQQREVLSETGSDNDIFKRRSIQEIVNNEFSDSTWEHINDTAEPTTTAKIMDSLDDPELNESLEDEAVRDGSFVASSSVENSFCINPGLIHADGQSVPSTSSLGSNSRTVLSSPKAAGLQSINISNIENESSGESESETADKTWKPPEESGNDSTFRGQSEAQTDISLTENESSLNVSSQSEIPKVVGSIDDKDLHVPSNTKKTKYNFCFYCNKMQAVISRHLETVHKDKSPVKKFSVFPKGNAERRKMIETIRLKGNYLYNTDKTYNKTGELLAARRPKEERSGIYYKTCHNCSVVLSKKTIRRHRQSCIGNSAKGERSNTIFSRRIEGRIHEIANDRLVNVFMVLKEDDIVRLIRYDELIIRFGNCLCDKYWKQQQDDMIRNRLRTLGKLLLIMKEIDPSIADFKSIYQPQRYNIMLKAVRKMAGFNGLTGEYDVPSIPPTMKTYITAVGEILKLYWVENMNEEQEKIIDKYLFLHKMQYSQAVSRVALEDQAKKHRQLVKPLPTTGDIKKFSTYLAKNCHEAYKSLQKQYSYESWLKLLKYTLISIQTFNRRRAGEIERVLISDLKAIEKISQENHREIYQNLSGAEKVMAEEYSRFVITGKLGRDVPVLINFQMEKSLSLLLEYRSSTKIPAKNPYVFGVPGFADGRFKYLRACQLMREFSVECGAEHPDRLRGTYLRKHVATACAADNIDENKISDIANFMGHAEAIHRSHYRRSVITRDVIGVASILRKAQGDNEIVENDSDNGQAAMLQCSSSQQQHNDDRVNSDSLNQSPFGVRKLCDERSKKRKRLIVQSSSDESDNDSCPGSSVPKKKNVKKPVSKKSKNDCSEKRRKIRWTDEEKKVAFSAFGKLIESNKNPTTNDIKKFLKDNPQITRTVDQIRTWASNEKKKINLDYRD